MYASSIFFSRPGCVIDPLACGWLLGTRQTLLQQGPVEMPMHMGMHHHQRSQGPTGSGKISSPGGSPTDGGRISLEAGRSAGARASIFRVTTALNAATALQEGAVSERRSPSPSSPVRDRQDALDISALNSARSLHLRSGGERAHPHLSALRNHASTATFRLRQPQVRACME